MGMTFAAWTYDGKIPGPTLEVCQGDRVTLSVNNKGTTSHGLDTHAFKVDARRYGSTAPGKAGVYPFVDHEKLAYLPMGLALTFAAHGVPAAVHRAQLVHCRSSIQPVAALRGLPEMSRRSGRDCRPACCRSSYFWCCAHRACTGVWRGRR